MKWYIPLLFLCYTTLSSCVTLLSSRNVKVPVKAPRGTTLSWHSNGHTETEETPHRGTVTVTVPRAREPLEITASNDSVHTHLSIRSTVNSFIFMNFYGFGLPGFVVDMCSPKRFTYLPTYIELKHTPHGTEFVTVRRRSYFKGSAELIWMSPLMNGWTYNVRGYAPRLTVMGAGIGATYYYTPTAFVAVEGAISAPTVSGRDRSNIPLSGRGAVEEQLSGWNAAARHHNRFGRFDVGYGIGVAQRWAWRYWPLYGNGYSYDKLTDERRSIYSFGTSLYAGFRLSNALFAHVGYQPQLLAVERGVSFDYIHYFNFGFNWHLRVSSY